MVKRKLEQNKIDLQHLPISAVKWNFQAVAKMASNKNIERYCSNIKGMKLSFYYSGKTIF